MTIINFSKSPLMNRHSSKMSGKMVTTFPDYPGVALKALKEDDIITIRVFFGIGKGDKMRVDGGHIDLRVEFVDENSVMAVIITQLPEHFPWKTGESIEVFEEEILYKTDFQ